MVFVVADHGWQYMMDRRDECLMAEEAGEREAIALISTITGGMSESSGCRLGGCTKGADGRDGGMGAPFEGQGGAWQQGIWHCVAGLGVLSKGKKKSKRLQPFDPRHPPVCARPSLPLSL